MLNLKKNKQWLLLEEMQHLKIEDNMNIKKLLREGLLAEKLTNVDSDVDLIYNTYFKKDIDEISKTGVITRYMFDMPTTDTSVLKDDASIKANELNPCKILINNGGNHYAPLQHIISVSINDGARDFILDNFNGIITNAVDYLSDLNQKKSLEQEFTEHKIKGSIHHELAHWIDDTMNNNHIQKVIKKAQEYRSNSLYDIPVNATKMEIQGQIHNIKQLYNKYKDTWDTLSWNNLIELSPSLSNINKILTGNINTKWVRDLKIRMHREGLLGKNMINR